MYSKVFESFGKKFNLICLKKTPVQFPGYKISMAANLHASNTKSFPNVNVTCEQHTSYTCQCMFKNASYMT